MRKNFVLVCMLLCIMLLTGCESSEVREAKELIDDIYHDYDLIDQAEYELQYATDEAEINSLVREISILELQVDISTRSYGDVYESLSDREREEVDAYLDEVVNQRIEDIWNN